MRIWHMRGRVGAMRMSAMRLRAREDGLAHLVHGRTEHPQRTGVNRGFMPQCLISPMPFSSLLVKEIIDPTGGFGIDPGHPGEIRDRGALDRLESPEMVEQGAPAHRSDAGDLAQS